MDIDFPLLDNESVLYEFIVGIPVISFPLLDSVGSVFPFDLTIPESITFPLINNVSELYIFSLRASGVDSSAIVFPTIVPVQEQTTSFTLGNEHGIFF